MRMETLGDPMLDFDSMNDLTISFLGGTATNFSNLPSFVLDCLEAEGKPLGSMTTAERREAVAYLDSIGFFSLRNSIDVLCERSFTSRVCLYGDIKKAQNRG